MSDASGSAHEADTMRNDIRFAASEKAPAPAQTSPIDRGTGKGCSSHFGAKPSLPREAKRLLLAFESTKHMSQLLRP